MTITTITDFDRCEALWREHASGGLPFGDWELRRALAELCGVTPRFLVDEASGTVLPGGLHQGILYFYGGLRYSEHNDFIGPAGGERRILAGLAEAGMPVRLLSWARDPVDFVPDEMLGWDVPYNQYWMFDGKASYEQHIDALVRRNRKEARYLGRKFELAPGDTGDAPASLALIDSFMDATVEAFAKRGARCVYARPDLRAMGHLVCETLLRRGVLRSTRIVYGGETVGLAVLADDPESANAAYLFNLYRPSPSDISNGGTLAALRYGGERGRPVDGMRGAFTLKPKFGFVPAPSYALVSDPAWVQRPQSDLDEDTLLALYGRRFGQRRDTSDTAAAPPMTADARR